MNTIDLLNFGFKFSCQITGKVEHSWLGGSRLVFLFAENHQNSVMKSINVLNACTLFDCGRLACAGTEGPLTNLTFLTQATIECFSTELLQLHKSDSGVVKYLRENSISWFGTFGFGNTLKVLRPSLAVRCVEDPALGEEMKTIVGDYDLYQVGARTHPSPCHPNVGDHPHNLKRENAMIINLLSLWSENAHDLPAILNTGADHSQRIARSLRDRGISYIHVSVPTQ